MDLGATICTPRNPACPLCPWREHCAAFREGDADSFPKKAPKKQKPTRVGVAFWLEDQRGLVLIRRREERGLLGGMMEFPSTDWVEGTWQTDEALAAAPIKTDWQMVSGMVRHSFTHFHLELTVFRGRSSREREPRGVWCEVENSGTMRCPL